MKKFLGEIPPCSVARVAPLLALTLFSVGCAAAATDDGAVAVVTLSADHTITFLEPSPGVIALHEQARGGVPRLGRKGDADLVRRPLVEQYAALAGSDRIPSEIRARLDAAEQRRLDLRRRMNSGEIPAPPVTAAGSPTPTMAFTDTVVDTWQGSVQDFYDVFCPNPASFSAQWCFDIPPGNWSTGWSANTSFFRSVALTNSFGASYYRHEIQRWNGSQWAQVWEWVHHPTDVNLYSFYVTDFPWTLANFDRFTGSWSDVAQAAAVWNFQ